MHHFLAILHLNRVALCDVTKGTPPLLETQSFARRLGLFPRLTTIRKPFRTHLLCFSSRKFTVRGSQRAAGQNTSTEPMQQKHLISTRWEQRAECRLKEPLTLDLKKLRLAGAAVLPACHSSPLRWPTSRRRFSTLPAATAATRLLIHYLKHLA